MTDAVTSSTSATQATVQPAQPTDKLKAVAKQFEAVFLRQMIGSMRTASASEGIFDSSATEQFRTMSDSKLADTMAEKGVLHVADLLVKQFGARVTGTATAGGDATKDSAK
ncbi:rod-binding protein [Sphingomonas sp. BIUV-7]|uniref:Rod-binding protein n=1 Tax=Sphingomonas natans TaxID=3063330 RepID=A0ABT8YF22_9SPHN|nr:rod-binding protein [Sphingomonas sp. BIUV-7]MDO6416547.1 rod-binding protein [Sphingomonas sp. BIUV-7]